MAFQNDIRYGILERQRVNNLLKELFRKSIHICSSLVPLFLYVAYWPTIFALCFALIFYTISEFCRLNNKPIPLISKITETAARKRDENKFVLGPVTLVIGILLAAIFLPLDCAKVGIFALAFGDGFASLVGKMIGKITIPGSKGKTVAGSLACFLAVYVATFCCCKNTILSFSVAICGMLIEVLPLLDFDNVIIPLSIGGIYYLMSLVF